MDMIKIVEVGPRDGLQNEPVMIPTDAKVAFVDALSETGVSEIEVSAFVSEKWVPQLKDAAAVFQAIHRKKGVTYSALVPNTKGLERAVEAGARKISVFTAASETFNRKNINTSIEGSLKRLQPVIREAKQQGLPVRGYISTAFWCAFEGRIHPETVVDLALRLKDMGVDEISVSDTIGRATPDEVSGLMDLLLPGVPADHLAVHFHDTYARGIPNVLQSLSYGIGVVDASAGGLGGCPFSPGATGNVSTQSVVEALETEGYPVNVDLERIEKAFQTLSGYLPGDKGRKPLPELLDCANCEFNNTDQCCREKPAVL